MARDIHARYYAYPYPTLVHIVPGILFMVLGPLQSMPSIRNRWLRFHRWSGRVFMVASLVCVISALMFVPMLPVFGSFSTSVGVVFAGSIFPVCLVQCDRRIRQRRIAPHREWIIGAFAIGLGISTFRVMTSSVMMPPLRATFP